MTFIKIPNRKNAKKLITVSLVATGILVCVYWIANFYYTPILDTHKFGVEGLDEDKPLSYRVLTENVNSNKQVSFYFLVLLSFLNFFTKVYRVSKYVFSDV